MPVTQYLRHPFPTFRTPNVEPEGVEQESSDVETVQQAPDADVTANKPYMTQLRTLGGEASALLPQQVMEPDIEGFLILAVMEAKARHDPRTKLARQRSQRAWHM